MKKLMLLAALLAMGLLLAVPAMAQVGQEGEQEGESGEVDQSFTVTGSGSNGNSCAPLQGSAQSGNSQNQTDVLQERSASDEFEFEENGSDITSSGSNSTECIQEVNQAASAAAAPKTTPPPPPPPPAPKAAPAPAPAPKAAPAPAPKTEEAKAQKAEVKAQKAEVKAQKAEAKAQKAEAKKALPKTGGTGAASLFALGAGALLVAAGLLARRLAR